jgi:PTS system nitrogen regulatory IIA component
MNFRDLISEQNICLFHGQNKKQILKKLMERAVAAGAVHEKDKGALTEHIFHREDLMSTGIGIGIAIPHARFAGVVKPLIIIGIQAEGIADYVSIDDKPVQIVFMILVRQNKHREYIELLSHVVGFLKSNEVKERLLSARTESEVHTFIKGKENA